MKRTTPKYDVLVVGGGHAGYEACAAAAGMGCATLLVTMNLDTIGLMSCNPAIGGLAKGQLVREIDALGGMMATAIDATAIQFRVLNTKKGPAVRSSRAQADRQLYRLWIKESLESIGNLDIKHGLVESLLVENGRVVGVETAIGERFRSSAVILAPGTFMNGLVHIGLKSFPAGRLGEPPSNGLSNCLRSLGLEMGRLKTGTTPRLDSRSVDFKAMQKQEGDVRPRPFSFSTESISRPQLPCYITYTNEKTHAVIREGFDRSPLYTGVIKGTGARYCPSIEDKVRRFPEKNRHQVFIEPEGCRTVELYPSGIPTSLPLDIQTRMVQSIAGLEAAEIMRPGYAIEYDFVDPVQMRATLETKKIGGLYLAGQINGTSGYEEAGAQGLMAGINAALKAKGQKPFILGRDEAYIGVLIDDLVTKGTREPYRMFTSRAEYRLILREDNADLRLREKGHRLGLVDKASADALQRKQKMISEELERVGQVKVQPLPELQKWLASCGSGSLRATTTIRDLLKRPELDYNKLAEQGMVPESLPEGVREQVEIQIKYDGYIQRQQQMIDKFNKLEQQSIPFDIDYRQVPGLSIEVREKLCSVQPRSLGQAARVSGITPAAVSILMVFLRKYAARTGGERGPAGTGAP